MGDLAVRSCNLYFVFLYYLAQKSLEIFIYMKKNCEKKMINEKLILKNGLIPFYQTVAIDFLQISWKSF